MTVTADRFFKRGVTLVEVTLAGALFSFVVLGLFEGIAVAARIARENSEYLAADAYAFDLAWKRFNEDYSKLKALRSELNGRIITEAISSNAVPILYIPGSEAVARTTITWPRDNANQERQDGLVISVDVEWGPAGKRHRLSTTHTATIFKSSVEQEGG